MSKVIYTCSPTALRRGIKLHPGKLASFQRNTVFSGVGTNSDLPSFTNRSDRISRILSTDHATNKASLAALNFAFNTKPPKLSEGLDQLQISSEKEHFIVDEGYHMLSYLSSGAALSKDFSSCIGIAVRGKIGRKVAFWLGHSNQNNPAGFDMLGEHIVWLQDLGFREMQILVWFSSLNKTDTESLARYIELLSSTKKAVFHERFYDRHKYQARVLTAAISRAGVGLETLTRVVTSKGTYNVTNIDVFPW